MQLLTTISLQNIEEIRSVAMCLYRLLALKNDDIRRLTLIQKKSPIKMHVTISKKHKTYPTQCAIYTLSSSYFSRPYVKHYGAESDSEVAFVISSLRDFTTFLKEYQQE